MESIHFAYRRKDDAVEGIALVKASSLRVSSNGSKYLDLTLMDASGEINAKAWNWGENPVPEAGTVVLLRGLVGEFAGKLQLRVDKLRQVQGEEVDWSQLVPCAPESPEAMYRELYETAGALSKEGLRLLAQTLLEENREQLDGIVELLTEVLCTRRSFIRISGVDYPAQMVKERFGQINSLHIQYMFECLENTASRIRNIRQYLLATLFNAPVTKGSYYDARVRYDRSLGWLCPPAKAAQV